MIRYTIQFDSGRRYLIFDGATSTCPVHQRGQVYWMPEHVKDSQDQFADGSATAEQAEAGAAQFERDYQDVIGLFD